MRAFSDALWEHPYQGRPELIAEIERQLGVDGRTLAPARLPDELVTLPGRRRDRRAQHQPLQPVAPVGRRRRGGNDDLAGAAAGAVRSAGDQVRVPSRPGGTRGRNRRPRRGILIRVGTRSEINTHPLPVYELDRIGMPDAATADFKRSWGTLARRLGAAARDAA